MSITQTIDKRQYKGRHPRPIEPSKPLPQTSRELFAQAVAKGVPVIEAYRKAGYKGGRYAMSDLRRSPDVDARVTELLQERIRSDTARRHAAEKPIADLQQRLIKRLEKVAFSDVRDVQQWRREPIIDGSGTVVGFRDVIATTPSHKLKPGEAATVKGLKTKGGVIQVEFHDPLAAIDRLCRIAGLYPDTQPASVTVNQLNVNQGSDTALEAARKLAFALAAAQQAAQLAAPAGKTIEGEAVEATEKPKE